MTDQQLDDLERLLRERDEARAALVAFLGRPDVASLSVYYGAVGKEYDRLAAVSWTANRKFETALREAAPALVAEVRRLRAELRSIADMWLWAADDSDDVNWVGIAAAMSDRAEEALGED